MKIISSTTNRAVLLGIALLGASTLVGFATPASAQPQRDHDAAQNRDNTWTQDDTRDYRGERNDRDDDTAAPQDLQQPGAFGGRRGGRGSGFQGPQGRGPGSRGPEGPNFGGGSRNGGLQHFENQGGPRHQRMRRPDFQGQDEGPSRRDFQGQGQGHFTGQTRPERPSFQGGPQFHSQGQGGFGRRRPNQPGEFSRSDDSRQEFPRNGGFINPSRAIPNGGFQNGGNSYTGTITRLRSNQSFDVSIGGKTFNVYSNGRLPGSLSIGDTVQVNGVKAGKNDIRNASVSLLRNR